MKNCFKDLSQSNFLVGNNFFSNQNVAKAFLFLFQQKGGKIGLISMNIIMLQGFSYLFEVRARGLLILGRKAFGPSILGKSWCSPKELDDQRSLISVFVIRLLESIISTLTLLMLQIFNFLASLCSWAGCFELHCDRNSEDRFCRVKAHM